jgi:outer membrane protein OmpA-like peptidoglycan-associated protein
MDPGCCVKDTSKSRALMMFLFIAVALGKAVSQLQPAKIEPISGKVLDLVFRVEEMGGKVQLLDVKESPTEVRIELAADVLFDFDKAGILPKAQATLSQAAGMIREKAHGTVRIEGHTDAKGSDTYNQKLSERRAEAVKMWFIQKEGLGKVPFATEGLGARKPVAPNKKPDGSDDPEGRQKNRRVEIIIKKS